MKKRFTLLLGGLAWLLALMPLAHVSAQTVGTEPSLNAPSAIAIDATNGQILYQKNPLQLYDIGNLTKLLSLLVIYEALDQGQISLEDQVSISDQAYQLSQDYNLSNVPLRQDYQYSVQELLEAVQVGSANGALLALAEHVAGSQDQFRDRMTVKVQSLLADTSQINERDLADWQALTPQLSNVTGLPPESGAPSNQLNALLLSAVSYQLLNQHPEVVEQTQIAQKLFRQGTDDEFEMHTSNQMLAGQAYAYPQVDGLMSATTTDGQYVTAQTMIQDQLRVIVITLGNREESQAYHDSKKLLEYVYATYQVKHVMSRGDTVSQIEELVAYDGESETVQAFYGENLDLVVPIIDTTPRIEYQFEPDTQLLTPTGTGWNVAAPQTGGQTLGMVQATIKQYDMRFVPGSKTNRVSVRLSHDIKEASFLTKMWRSIGRFFAALGEAIRQFFTNLFN